MQTFISKTHTSSLPTKIAVLVAASILLFGMLSSVHVRADTQSSSATLTVLSASTTGQLLTGYYTFVSQNGAMVGSGFSPMSFSLNSNQSYTLTMDNFGSCTFDHFVGGGANGMTVYPSANTEEIAIYNCTTSFVTFNAVDQHGNALTGYLVSIWQNGGLQGSDYTPITFNIYTNDQYTATAANFGSCTFANWQGGGSALSFTAGGQGQTFTAVYNCA